LGGRDQASAQERDEQQDRGASLQKVESHGVSNPSLWNTVPGRLHFRLNQMFDAHMISAQRDTSPSNKKLTVSCHPE
jgi:hypothetical protein